MLKSKGVKLRDGVATHHNVYLLRMKPHALKGKGATPTKKKATKEKSSSNFPLAEVAKKAKRKLEWWKIVKLRKLPKPPRVPKSKGKAVKQSKKPGPRIRRARMLRSQKYKAA